MSHKPGTNAPSTGIYWCSVCKLPQRFTAGEELPECSNMCGRGNWELVEKQAAAAPKPAANENRQN
jgi:hypothetical protein